jgi:glycosyltransferase involved in cell wall biosynthesis
MTNQPLVSILINNYNYGRFLAEAIDSALQQDYPHIEIVVVDDGSTDHSRQIIANYGEQIIPVLKENGGQASAFNQGFAHSSGEIICFLDADDIIVPHKISTIIRIFAQHPDIEWCFHRLNFVNFDTGELLGANRETETRLCDLRQETQRGTLKFTAPPTSGLCFRRSLLNRILPMPEMIRITSDNYLKLLAIGLSKGFYLDDPLTNLRIHGNNAYSLRDDKQGFKAYIRVLTAYSIRQNWNILTKPANKLFAIGLGQLWKYRSKHLDEKGLISQYFSVISPWERSEIMARAFYHYLKA